MFAKIGGQVMGVVRREPKEGKAYQELQLLQKNSGKMGDKFELVTVKSYNGLKFEVGKNVDMVVYIGATEYKGRAYLNVAVQD